MNYYFKKNRIKNYSLHYIDEAGIKRVENGSRKARRGIAKYAKI